MQIRWSMNKSLQKTVEWISSDKVIARTLDIEDSGALQDQMKDHDVGIIEAAIGGHYCVAYFRNNNSHHEFFSFIANPNIFKKY